MALAVPAVLAPNCGGASRPTSTSCRFQLFTTAGGPRHALVPVRFTYLLPAWNRQPTRLPSPLAPTIALLGLAYVGAARTTLCRRRGHVTSLINQRPHRDGWLALGPFGRDETLVRMMRGRLPVSMWGGIRSRRSHGRFAALKVGLGRSPYPRGYRFGRRPFIAVFAPARPSIAAGSRSASRSCATVRKRTQFPGAGRSPNAITCMWREKSTHRSFMWLPASSHQQWFAV